jgi:uncharacterized RDD family membrane protein YckC
VVIYGIADGASVATVIRKCWVATDGATWCANDNFSSVVIVALGLAAIVAFVYSVWNWGYREGATGSTIGKSVLKFKVVSAESGQPIGFDSKRRIGTVVVTVVLVALLTAGVRAYLSYGGAVDWKAHLSHW